MCISSKTVVGVKGVTQLPIHFEINDIFIKCNSGINAAKKSQKYSRASIIRTFRLSELVSLVPFYS